MNREEHTIVAMIVLSVILATGILNFIDGKDSLLIFGITFTIFSTAVSPDIDQRIPGVAHRGITHSWKGLIVIAAVLGISVYVALSYTSDSRPAAIIFPLILGATGAWFLHMASDKIYDIFRGFSWVIIAGLIGLLYWYIK